MGKALKHNDGTNNTFADPMVRVEALSTSGQTVALAQNLGVGAGCTLRGLWSRAAGTWVMTNWGREWEGNTKWLRWPKSPLLDWAPNALGSPLLYHLQPPFSSHTKSREKMCPEVIIIRRTAHIVLSPSFIHVLLFITYYYLLFIICIKGFTCIVTFIFIVILWGRYYLPHFTDEKKVRSWEVKKFTQDPRAN